MKTTEKGFEIGKSYKHTTGKYVHVLCEIETMLRGHGLLVEVSDCTNDELAQFGMLPENAVNWSEISNEEWEAQFKND